MKLAQGQIPVDELARVRKAHDVRTLRVCGGCGGMGNSHSMIFRKVPLDNAPTVLREEWLHGRCFVSRYGRAKLTQLPKEQTDRLTIGDIGVRTMKYLIDYKTR
jgi:hypothetical protein